jgi:hypothetical protein
MSNALTEGWGLIAVNKAQAASCCADPNGEL